MMKQVINYSQWLAGDILAPSHLTNINRARQVSTIFQCYIVAEYGT